MKIQFLEDLTLKKANYFSPPPRILQVAWKACKGTIPPMPVMGETATSNNLKGKRYFKRVKSESDRKKNLDEDNEIS